MSFLLVWQEKRYNFNSSNWTAIVVLAAFIIFIWNLEEKRSVPLTNQSDVAGFEVLVTHGLQVAGLETLKNYLLLYSPLLQILFPLLFSQVAKSWQKTFFFLTYEFLTVPLGSNSRTLSNILCFLPFFLLTLFLWLLVKRVARQTRLTSSHNHIKITTKI